MTVCALYLEAGPCGIRAEGSPVIGEALDGYGHHHSHPEVKDLSIRAFVIHSKFPYDKFYVSSLFWGWGAGVYANENIAGKTLSLKANLILSPSCTVWSPLT